MLFISPHPNFQLTGIIPSRDEHHPATGMYLRTIPGVDAEFFHGGCPSWALDIALNTPQFLQRWKGLPDGVNYGAYVSSYDTKFQQEQHGWDDETREYVEEFLLKNAAYGERYILAESPQELQQPPWPTYDQTQWKQVVHLARETGQLEYTLEYEQNHKNREGIVNQLLEALQTDAPAEVEEPVPA